MSSVWRSEEGEGERRMGVRWGEKGQAPEVGGSSS